MTQASDSPVNPFVVRMPHAFWWTVKVPVPGNDDYQLAALLLQFKPVAQQRLDQMSGTELPTDERPLPSEADICREVVVGWSGVQGEDGEVLYFSPTALDALLNVPVVRSAIVATYMAVMRGMGARKNA